MEDIPMFKPYKKTKSLVALMLLLTMLFSFIPSTHAETLKSAPLSRGTTQDGMVRVRLSSLGNPSSLKLTVNGSYTVNGKTSKAIASGTVLNVGFSSSTGKLTLTHNGNTTDMGTSFKLRRHATDGSNGIKIAQGRVPSNLYPGDFEFIVQKGANSYTLLVIVHVYIEDYLYGVLPYEMGNSSGLEALKAQAVTARTYTMRAMTNSASSAYDVVDTPSDQVYSGTPSGNANCKAAVDATKGIVSKNGSSFTATYYSASNGGQTEAIKNAWGTSSYSYLKVKDDPYDLANPAAKKTSFTVNKNGTQSNTTLQSLLNNKAASKFGTGAVVNGVSAIQLHTPKYASPSKLYTKADFTVRYTRNGVSNSGTVTFNIFSELEAPLNMSINSGTNELWYVDETENGFTVTARRYGHGIGMSQRGAMYMAQMGYTYDQILAFYFEGCSRVQYTFTRSILSPIINGQDSSEETIIERPADLEEDPEHAAQISAAQGADLMNSTESSAYVLAHLPKEARVEVCQQAGNMYLVKYGSLCGYISADALNFVGTATGEQASPTVLYGYGTVVRSNALNLRSAATSEKNNVITTIPGKTRLPVFSLNGNWAYVQYGLRVGYVSLDYIDLQPISAITTPTQAPVPPQPPVAEKARVTTVRGSLNLRVSDSSTARVLCTIPQYTVIDVTQRLNGWCAVSYRGYNGYVMEEFLTFLTDEQQSTPLPTATPAVSGNRYARVTTAKGSLNLRNAPSSTARVLRTIPQYETVQVYQDDGKWCYVNYSGYLGYVMREFLTYVNTAPTQTPVLTAVPAPIATPVPTQPTATSAPQRGSYARVTTQKGSLNLRVEKGGKVLRTIPQYEIVEVIEKGMEWCMVRYAGVTGYAMSKFLTFLSVSPSSTTPPSIQQTATPVPTAGSVQTASVKTEKGSLNLRAIPDGKVLRTVPQYATVNVISRGTSWTQVSYQGIAGYVMTKFLSFNTVQPVPTQVPAATQPPQVTPIPEQSGQQVVCYAIVMTPRGSLNLRKYADGDAKVLLTIPQYTQISVLQKGSSWSLVSYMGETGYVMNSFLSFSNNIVPAVTPIPVNTQTPLPAATSTPPVQNEQSPYMDPTLVKLKNVVLARVNADGSFLNLREYCSLDAAVLKEIPQGTYVVITKVGSEWCEVIHEDKMGYCLEKYLEYTP